MGAFQLVRPFFAWLESAIAGLSGPEFTCGDCELAESCGLPPTAECAGEQSERDPVAHKLRLKQRALQLHQYE